MAPLVQHPKNSPSPEPANLHLDDVGITLHETHEHGHTDNHESSLPSYQDTLSYKLASKEFCHALGRIQKLLKQNNHDTLQHPAVDRLFSPERNTREASSLSTRELQQLNAQFHPKKTSPCVSPIPSRCNSPRRLYNVEEHRAQIYEKHQLIVQDELDKIHNKVNEYNSKKEEAYQSFVNGQREQRASDQRNLWMTIIVSTIFANSSMEIITESKSTKKLARLFLPLYLRWRNKKNMRKLRERLLEEYSPKLVKPTVRDFANTFFNNWPPEVMASIVNSFTPLIMCSNDMVIRQGDAGYEMYYLQFGEVNVVISRKDKFTKRTTEMRVARLGPGSSIGEWALLTGERRMASVICNEACGLWMITSQQLSDSIHKSKDTTFIEQCIEMGLRKRKQNLEQSKWTVEKLQSLSTFKGLGDAMCELIISKLEGIVTRPGTVMFTEGDYGDSMFFIQDGEVEILQDVGEGEPKVLTVLENFGCFGEVSCVFNERRSATARCITKCDLWRITRSNFFDAVLSDIFSFMAIRSNIKATRLGWMAKCTRKFLQDCPYIKSNFSHHPHYKRILQEMLKCMDCDLFVSTESVVDRSTHCTGLSFIHRGVVVDQMDREYTVGKCLGEEHIFKRTRFPQSLTAQTFVEVYTIHEGNLAAILDQHYPEFIPVEYRRLRYSKPVRNSVSPTPDQKRRLFDSKCSTPELPSARSSVSSHKESFCLPSLGRFLPNSPPSRALDRGN